MVKWVRCPALGEKMATSLFNGYGTSTGARHLGGKLVAVGNR